MIYANFTPPSGSNCRVLCVENPSDAQIEKLVSLGYTGPLSLDEYEAKLASIPAWVDTVAPTVPSSVTNAQLRAALISEGIFPEQIDALINAMTNAAQKATARAWWDYANTFERGSSLVATFATALGKDKAWVDALFIKAEKLST